MTRTVQQNNIVCMDLKLYTCSNKESMIWDRTYRWRNHYSYSLSGLCALPVDNRIVSLAYIKELISDRFCFVTYCNITARGNFIILYYSKRVQERNKKKGANGVEITAQWLVREIKEGKQTCTVIDVGRKHQWFSNKPKQKCWSVIPELRAASRK